MVYLDVNCVCFHDAEDEWTTIIRSRLSLHFLFWTDAVAAILSAGAFSKGAKTLLSDSIICFPIGK
jgi:hypothetical protein